MGWATRLQSSYESRRGLLARGLSRTLNGRSFSRSGPILKIPTRGSPLRPSLQLLLLWPSCQIDVRPSKREKTWRKLVPWLDMLPGMGWYGCNFVTSDSYDLYSQVRNSKGNSRTCVGWPCFWNPYTGFCEPYTETGVRTDYFWGTFLTKVWFLSGSCYRKFTDIL